MEYANSAARDNYDLNYVCNNLERVTANLSNYSESERAGIIKTLEECRIILCSLVIEPKNLKIILSDTKMNIRVLLQIILLDVCSFKGDHPVNRAFEFTKIKYLGSVYNRCKSEVDSYMEQVINKIDNLAEGEKFLLSSSEWIIGSSKHKNSLSVFTKSNSDFCSKKELYNKIKLQHLANIQPIPNRLLLEMDDVER